MSRWGHASILRSITFATIIGSLLTAPGFSFAAHHQPWTEVRSPHFIVVSNASDHEARQLAYQFEMIRTVFETIRTVFLEYVGGTGAMDPPITILAAKDEGTLRTLLPEYWQSKNLMHPAGVFLGHDDANYIALRLDVSLDQKTYVPYETVYHEYVHYLMRDLHSHLPLWMVEGLAEFFGNTRIQSERVSVGVPSEYLVWLRQKFPLPFGALFDVDASSPYYQEESKIRIFYAESWALTHYLIARDGNEKTHRVRDFIALLGRGVDQREAAGRTIGSPESLEPVLRKYVQNLLLSDMVLDSPKIDNSRFQARLMSEAESLSVQADFMAHKGSYRQAQTMLEEAVKMDSKLGIAYESMSFLYATQGHAAEASKWASQAVALNPQSLRANYCDAVALMASGIRDEQTLLKAESRLRTALKINPEFAPAYDRLAFVLSEPGPKQDLNEAYMATLHAEARDPSNIDYRVRSVEVLVKQGRTKDAIRAATLALSMAKTPEEQSIAAAALAHANELLSFQNKMAAELVVSPTSTQVVIGQKHQFSAVVTSGLSSKVTWKISGSGCSGPACGNISADGLYTAPSIVPNPPLIAVTATLTDDPTVTASATLTVTDALNSH